MTPLPVALLVLGVGALAAAVRRRRARGGAASGRSRGLSRGPVSDVSKLVDPGVFRDFPAWVSARSEGNVNTMYQDVKGLITTARGYVENSRGCCG